MRKHSFRKKQFLGIFFSSLPVWTLYIMHTTLNILSIRDICIFKCEWMSFLSAHWAKHGCSSIIWNLAFGFTHVKFFASWHDVKQRQRTCELMWKAVYNGCTKVMHQASCHKRWIHRSVTDLAFENCQHHLLALISAKLDHTLLLAWTPNQYPSLIKQTWDAHFHL